MARKARRSVCNNCLLLSPVASCMERALKRCSAASLCAPMFKPMKKQVHECYRTGRPDATYKQRQRCRSHGYMWGAVSALRGTRLGTPQACFRLKVTSPGGSKGDSPDAKGSVRGLIANSECIPSAGHLVQLRNNPWRGRMLHWCKRAHQEPVARQDRSRLVRAVCVRHSGTPQ
jgi:hypothetical protein